MSTLAKYFLLAFPVSSAGLGVWQLKRLEWKNGLIASLNARLTDQPIDLLAIESLEDLEDKEYKRVRARGSFDQRPDHMAVIRPKQLVVNGDALARGRTAHQQNTGVNIVSPFQLDGTDLRILVNRGWLANKGTDGVEEHAKKGMGQPGEIVDLQGILRTSEKRPSYGMARDQTSNEWNSRDILDMARALNTAPIFLDLADKISPALEGPIPGQTVLKVRNEHLNYAITWFGLAAFSLLMWYSKYGKRGGKMAARNRAAGYR